MKNHSTGLPILISCSQKREARDTSVTLRPDQEGFYPKAPKIAVMAGYRGEPFRAQLFRNSYVITRIADFSTLAKTGRFRIKGPGCCQSGIPRQYDGNPSK